MDSGVHASLHPHYHHQTIFAKFDLKVFYPPSYERTVWHFSQANFDNIKRAVDLFDWESALIDLDVNIVIRNGKIVWKHWPCLAEFQC